MANKLFKNKYIKDFMKLVLTGLVMIASTSVSLFSNDSVLGKRQLDNADFQQIIISELKEVESLKKPKLSQHVVAKRLEQHKNCFSKEGLSCVMCTGQNPPRFHEYKGIVEHNREIHSTIKRWKCFACGTTSDHKNYIIHAVKHTDIKDVLDLFARFDDRFPHEFRNGKTLKAMRKEAGQSLVPSPILAEQKFQELKKTISIFRK
jgi:hypothetical protein